MSANYTAGLAHDAPLPIRYVMNEDAFYELENVLKACSAAEELMNAASVSNDEIDLGGLACLMQVLTQAGKQALAQGSLGRTLVAPALPS